MTTGAGTQGREGGENLQTAAANWPTATVGDSRSGLPAPTTPTAGATSSSGGPGSPRLWQTPATFQGKFRRQVGQTERTEELLPAQAERVASKTITLDEADRLVEEGARRLNPMFTLWLMGFPPDWCHLPASTPSGQRETQ